MYKAPSKERNLGIRTNGDWRHRPISPSNSTSTPVRSASPNIPSPLPRPGRQNTTSKSVAALQQQWQQQQEPPMKPSRYPLTRRISSEIKYTPESTNDVEVIYDDDEGDDVEEERMVVIQDVRSRSPSIHRGSTGSVQSYFGQEFRVVKEGWMYRKNGLMQWKPVYAVAKHGNSVKPGGLYLYKDSKCTHHIQTYDMSEVLEVSPRAQEYKPGIKWEIRMLVKRDDITLATDDMTSRKDWIDSLTSIMGKVSLATQNELTSRIQTSEQMNRDLQQVAEELDTENHQLRAQIESLKEAAVKKEHQFQQEIELREAELKEALEKQERLFKKDYQAREQELAAELDRTRQALETKCEIYEREAKQWRAKYVELETRQSRNLDTDEKKVEMLEMEVLKWRHRVSELEEKQEQRKTSEKPTETNVTETLSDVNHPSNEATPALDEIKTSIHKLAETLEEAKSNWKQLEDDIQNAEGKEASQKHSLSLLADDINHLREELKTPSLTEKFDILIDMVENLQIGQSRLSSTLSEKPNTEKKPTEGYQEKLDAWMQETRNMIESHHPPGSELSAKIESVLMELIKSQEQNQEEQTKHIKTIGNYLQLMTNDIQNSAIPDLPALSQQLEDVVERLAVTESRLCQVNPGTLMAPSNWTPSPPAEELKNMSDDDRLTQLHNFVKNTERFMERALLALSRYEGEIIRRAVKEQVMALQDQNRYEENARKMHSDLHEFTALEHDPSLTNNANPDGQQQQQQQRSVQSVIDIHAKLSEIERLEIEKQGLEANLERELDKKQAELKFIKSEYDPNQLARELEPLMHQIAKLKRAAGDNTMAPESDDSGYTHMADESSSLSRHPLPVTPNRLSRYEDEGTERKLRFPNHRKSSFSSQSSENTENKQYYDQQSIKSPLIGARDRPRGKSPLAGFLGRK
ncbi:hypothetical protein BCV71DRAFT_244006 [Rhizopus microsporus]|uniref:PH domain-containing protein n=1 Tax=Rhizopus microsporus TaxID=58291 RepID=A0A1X0RZQ2_RHIZD|nr:hypothetical protein BCV71DRAFT_244006 [Rhizopus microsporus]